MKRSLAKHFEGWQVGAIMVFIVTSITGVIIPRSAVPEDLPPSSVTPDEIEDARLKIGAAGQRAMQQTFPESTRLLGARVRALGRAELEGDESRVAKAYEDVNDAAKRALLDDPEAVATMRAYQAARFIDAYCQFLRRGEAGDDLLELGGSTLAQFSQNDWFQRAGQTGPDLEVLLSGFFKRRFTRLTGARHVALQSDPVEERAVLGFMLAHPPRLSIEEESNLGGDGSGPFLLRRIDDLAALEPTYPVAFAKGIVLFRMGHFEASAVAFDTYLQQVHNGPYRLRATNYLKSAVEHTEGL